MSRAPAPSSVLAPRIAALRIGGLAALLVLILVGLVVREHLARAGGQEVRLAMEAVDPRSLLSGHYAVLNLAETLPADAPCPAGLDATAAGWIALAPQEGRHRVAGAGDSREAAAAFGPVAVRGRARCHDGFPAPREADGPARRARVTLDIGVSRFYADQRTAQAMEQALRGASPDDAAAFAIVSVGRDGKARLKGVEIGGVRTDLDWF